MRVLIAAGGTAGHINPALAIAGDDTTKSFRRVAADSRVGCLSGFLLGTAMP